MQDGIWRPASEIPIKTLRTLSFSPNPQPGRRFAAVCDSFWRIAPEALKVKSHGAVYLHPRRRGFLPRKGLGFSGARRAAAGAGLQGSAAQARSLSQSRPRNDVAVSAR